MKLGYYDSFDDLDSFTAECFAIIGSEITKLVHKKSSKSKGG